MYEIVLSISPPHMVTGPMQFITVGDMPAVKQMVSYSCGAKSERIYQAGHLVDVTWIKKPMRIAASDILVSKKY